LKVITRRLKRDKRALSNVIVVMLSLVLIVIVVGNVVLWSYQMNQLDLERIQENLKVLNATQITRSSWFTAENEFAVTSGSRISGNYQDTKALEGTYETFIELNETTQLFQPSAYNTIYDTTYLSGALADLRTDNGVYMTFRSYDSLTSPQIIYAHQETTAVAGTNYYLLNLINADAEGTTLSISATTTGRKLFGKWVYPLTGVSSIPASTWTIYYRASLSSPAVNAYCNVDILIRKNDGTIRTTITTQAASSPNLSTEFSTVSGTYPWANYTVIDQADYLEIDFYAEVTKESPGKYSYLRVDDGTLALSEQTRMTNVYLPSEYTCEVEFTGKSDTQSWNRLTWTADSALTKGSANVTLQLYDYTLSSYPTIGEGYIFYTSSATASTDETHNQTITTNPTDFRDATGTWRIKVKCVKATPEHFDLKLDLIAFETTTSNIYRLCIENSFSIDLSQYPLAYVHGLEILIRYNATQNTEKWFLKAYNWTDANFGDSEFNNTQGSQPIVNEWNEYAVSIRDGWKDYVWNNGTLLIEFLDEGLNATQATLEIDFLGVRAIIDGTRLDLINSSPMTTRIVAIWIVNLTNHQRYNANLFLNSGEETTYIRADIILPKSKFITRVVTERGNTAVFAGNEPTT